MKRIFIGTLFLIFGCSSWAQEAPNFKAPIHISSPNWIVGQDIVNSEYNTNNLSTQGVLFSAKVKKKIMPIQNGKIYRILPMSNGCSTVIIDHLNGWRAYYEGVTTKAKEMLHVKKGIPFARVCEPAGVPPYFYFRLEYKNEPVNTYPYIVNKP